MSALPGQNLQVMGMEILMYSSNSLDLTENGRQLLKVENMSLRLFESLF